MENAEPQSQANVETVATLLAAWERKRMEYIALSFGDSPKSEFRDLLVLGVTESFNAGFKAAVDLFSGERPGKAPSVVSGTEKQPVALDNPKSVLPTERKEPKP